MEVSGIRLAKVKRHVPLERKHLGRLVQQVEPKEVEGLYIFEREGPVVAVSVTGYVMCKASMTRHCRFYGFTDTWLQLGT